MVSCAILGNGALALPRFAAWGQTVSSATITEVLDSNQVFIQNQQAAVNSVAQRQQRVRTQAARTSMRFNNGALARLAHNSSLMVGQCAQLSRGTLLVNGTLNGCSTTTMAGVRGTLYTLDVSEAGETTIKVFEGEVLVGQPSNPDILNDEANEWNEERPDYDSPDADPNSNGDPDSALSATSSDHSGDRSGGDAALPSASAAFQGQSMAHKPVVMAGSPLGALAVGWPGGRMKQASENPSPDVPPAPSLSPTLDEGINPAVDASATEGPETSETVDFNQDTVLVIRAGQQVMINAEGDTAVISYLTADDFIDLVEGPLIQGFSTDIPGLSDLQRTFQQLYPRMPSVPPILSVPTLIIPPPTPYPPTYPPTHLPSPPPISPGPIY